MAWAFMADTIVAPQYWTKGLLSMVCPKCKVISPRAHVVMPASTTEVSVTFTLQRVAESGKKLGEGVQTGQEKSGG